MEQSILDLGTALAHGQTEVDIEIAGADNMKVKFKKKTASEMVKEPVETAGVSIQLPDSLAAVSAPDDPSSTLFLKVTL